MAGRSANESISSAKATIKSLYEGVAGVGGSEEETSKIGGMGRMGADATGSLEHPMMTRIDQHWEQTGDATKGEMGVGYGVGRQWGGK
jgi:hypothetical protein